MPNIEEGSWPTARDMHRIWDNTQRSIAKKRHAAKVRKISIISGAGVLALAATGAAIIIPATQFQIDNTVTCYSGQSTSSENISSAQADGMDPLAISGAIDACDASWEYGVIVPDKVVGPGDTNHGPVTTAPPLGACLSPDNTVAVFPLDDGQGNVLTQEQLCEKVNLRMAAG